MSLWKIVYKIIFQKHWIACLSYLDLAVVFHTGHTLASKQSDCFTQDYTINYYNLLIYDVYRNSALESISRGYTCRRHTLLHAFQWFWCILVFKIVFLWNIFFTIQLHVNVKQGKRNIKVHLPFLNWMEHQKCTWDYHKFGGIYLDGRMHPLFREADLRGCKRKVRF